MHEYSLVNSVIKSIISKTKDLNIKKIISIKIKLGKLKMVSKEEFNEVFSLLSSNTICEGAKLDIEETDGDILEIENIEAEYNDS